MLFSGIQVLVHNFFPQWAIYVQDSTSLLNSLGLLTIYAQNIIIQQVIKFSIFLFKSTGQTIIINKTNNLILNLTPGNVTQHSKIE